MKWIWIIVLALVGVIAAVFAFEYLTVGIGHLPSWIPGHVAGRRGHLHKRGLIAGVIAAAAFAGAGWLVYKNMLADKAAKAADTA
jgi:hypothetical protein